ncbi:MAG: TonB family protein [Candidatus Obscuribacterales bacterium]
MSLSIRLSMPVCLVILQLACDLSGSSLLGTFVGSLPALSQPETGFETATSSSATNSTSTSAAEQAKLSAEEAALRHKALMRAHRKRIIETGKNDHAPTPEEYSPELEYYKKQGRRQQQAGQNPAAPQAAGNQVELRTDIRLETERPSPPPPAGSAQFVSKRMHSESAAGATGAAANFQADAPNIDFKPYMAALSKKIKQHWTPPARHEKAQVSVNFILMPDGTIGNLQVTKHGSATADEAARQAILRAAPFAHLPAGCNSPKQINYDFAHSSHADEPSFQWGIH